MRNAILFLLVAACGGNNASTTPRNYTGIERMRFNQLAVLLNLPLFWANDADGDGAIDPDEVRALLFYPTGGEWVAEGRFTEAFDRAFEQINDAAFADPPDERQRLLAQEIGSCAPTLVETDLRELPAPHRAFADHMLRVADMIDRLYAQQV